MEIMEIQTFFPSGSSLTWQDYSVVLVLLVLMVLVGIYLGREEESTTELFSWGGEKSPGGRLVCRLWQLKSAP